MIGLYVIIVLLVFHIPVSAAPFDDSQAVQQRYDEFRQQDDTSGHHQASDETDRGEIFLVYGKKAMEAGNAGAALDYFLAGQEQAPNDGRFSMMLGQVYSRLGDNVLAESNLLTAVQQMPEAPEPLKLLADHYYRAGQLPEAASALQKLIQLVPDAHAFQDQLERVQREVGVESDMVRDVNSIFSIKFDERTHADLAGRFVDILQEAYAEQGSLLDYYPQKTIQVILYSRDDYDMTTGAPAWSAGRFDGKIRMPVSSKRVGHLNFRRILYHEYNHFIAQQLSRGRAPAWFYEGLAMIAESQSARTLQHLPAAHASGKLFGFDELEKSFERLETQAALLAYEQSYSFVYYLLRQFGWHTIKDLLVAFGQGAGAESAFASVFSGFGLDYAQLQVEWLADM